VLDGEVGETLLGQLDAVGLKGPAFWEDGWRRTTDSRHPIETPAAVAGLKMRATGAPVHIEAFGLLGADPVPMPLGELYSALIVAMNKAKFDALPPDQQKILIETAREAGAHQRKLDNDAIAEPAQETKDKGLEVVDGMDQKPFAEATKGVREMFVGEFGGAELLQKIDAAR
jgi:TRAP-type C4-dicarboxylate transport system substrate-binding protein